MWSKSWLHYINQMKWQSESAAQQVCVSEPAALFREAFQSIVIMSIGELLMAASTHMTTKKSFTTPVLLISVRSDEVDSLKWTLQDPMFSGGETSFRYFRNFKCPGGRQHTAEFNVKFLLFWWQHTVHWSVQHQNRQILWWGSDSLGHGNGTSGGAVWCPTHGASSS